MVDELERQSLLDNMLVIYILSDNGPSAEGLNGTISELLAQNAMPATVEDQLEVLDKVCGGLDALGGPKLESLYNHGLAYSGSPPFQGTRLVAGHIGGTSRGWSSGGRTRLNTKAKKRIRVTSNPS